MFTLLLSLSINLAQETIAFDPNLETKKDHQFKEETLRNKIRYGPLLLNLENLYIKDKNYIIEASSNKSKLFFMAINCEKSLINLTTPEIAWRGWLSPKFRFEEKILEDACKI